MFRYFDRYNSILLLREILCVYDREERGKEKGDRKRDTEKRERKRANVGLNINYIYYSVCVK